MLSTNRKGFTLIEMIMAIVLSTMVLGLIYTAIVNAQRITLAQTHRMEVQQNARTVLYYLSSRFRELDAADGDIFTPAANQIQYRSMRWIGALCSDPVISGSTVNLYLKSDMIMGIRDPDVTADSILVFRDGDVNTKSDDEWLFGVMNSSTAGTCDDGSTATIFAATMNEGTTAVVDSVFTGSPVRGFQAERMGSRSVDGRQWLSRMVADKSGSWGSIEELVGPVASTNGLLFTYLDTLGNTTATSTNVAAIRIQVIAESKQMDRLTDGTIGYRIDTLQTVVALRNNSE